MTLFLADLKVLTLYNRRVHQLKSYHGTPDELPGDDQRLQDARDRANAHLAEMIVYQLERAHDAVTCLTN